MVFNDKTTQTVREVPPVVMVGSPSAKEALSRRKSRRMMSARSCWRARERLATGSYFKHGTPRLRGGEREIASSAASAVFSKKLKTGSHC